MSRKDDQANRSNQMNPNNDAYWQSRGYDGRRDDWEDQMRHENVPTDRAKSNQETNSRK
ncbi:MAG: hypothetical protein OXN21_03160 [Chloroflexota bacterium]|nr:hypothetical protein [Chloroflexota bacterium]